MRCHRLTKYVQHIKKFFAGYNHSGCTAVAPNAIKTGSSNSSIEPPTPSNYYETGSTNYV